MNRSRQFPSIFNDVIGPVMRGPSSSHCAAAVRIGKMARDLMDGELKHVLVEFAPNGSLAATHASQGSDMGLFGGLLGWDASDARLLESSRAIREAGITVDIRISAYEAPHPNTYKLTLSNSTEQHDMLAISTGGGMIEIIELDGMKTSMAGDYYETLLYLDSCDDELLHYLSEHIEADHILSLNSVDARMIEIKAQRFLEKSALVQLAENFKIVRIKTFAPVLPVLSHKEMSVPFLTCEEMLHYNQDKKLEFWELALLYESERGNLSQEEVFQKMRKIVALMQQSIREGIAGTDYAERILGYQSGSFLSRLQENRLLDAGILNHIILAVTAMMEKKSSMGVIVAAPTAGACGGLPGACIGAAGAMGLSLEEMTKAMLAAGMIGVFIAAHATFAAEVGGCQAECGAGSGMAAAALVTLAKGSVTQAVDAASIALQNILGLVCDPVANRVEVPCLGRNVMAASNALACANMALANFDAVIPLDEVIETMDSVGRSLPAELRCTALGGLSMTRTSKDIEKRFEHFSKVR
ncbi:probable L-serine dehydratase, alpha chain [Candidatus Vecturithrix granuli]|uniref:L-serine ammonia-lyase n=1 Tax=Vecturithrix granuli TaxID=1499967 RepID=A0A081C4L7_VECG1|nr:probable L-serine dehydratase, alpha chain [Candidatus Vecturithrix granuli]